MHDHLLLAVRLRRRLWPPQKNGSDKTPAPTMLFARLAVLAAVDKSTDGKLAAGEPVRPVCGGRTNVAFSVLLAIQFTA